MSLVEDIETAWKTAMKARDPQKDALSLIRAELKNKVISSRKIGVDPPAELPDDVTLSVLSKLAKQRVESINEYGKAGRDDLVSKEKFELEVIEKFLPKQLTQDELLELVRAVIKETGATSPKDIGRVMKSALAKAAGRVDGAQIQAVARTILL